MLQLGDSGPGVRAWQRIVGIDYRHVDGDFGPNTDAAVKAWQGARGIEQDGVIGPITRAAVELGAIIKAYEGLRTRAYDDHDSVPLILVSHVWRRISDGARVIGYPTIGWGRRLFPGEWIETCSKAEADLWFNKRIASTEAPAINRLSITGACERAAAASFSYNNGTGALAKLFANGISKDEWLSYCHTKGVKDAGLLSRRNEEWALYMGVAK